MSISINSASMYQLYDTASMNNKNKLESLSSKDLETAEDQELLEACKAFETYFVEQVFKEMSKTVETSLKNEYTEYFGDMLQEKYAENVTESGSLGIAQLLYESMKR